MAEKTVELQFSLNSDNFRLLENDGYCSIAEVDFLHLGLNRNRCNITKECVQKSLKSFYNKPLLCILDNSFDSSLAVDFKEHARSETDKNKFIAFGTIPESSTFRFLERDNEKTYLSAKVVIWKNYFPVIMNILKRRGNVKVSIELAVIDGVQDEDTGVLDINEFRLLSCVLLGEGIMEGIEGSHIEVLRFAYNQEDMKKANEYYLNFSSNNEKYEVPEEVQNAVQDGLKSYKSIGKGCTTQDVAMAKSLANETYIDKIKVNKVSQKLSKAKDKNKSLTFDILGGEVMENWLNGLDIERAGDNRLKSLSNNELQEQLWKDLEKYKYHDGEWEGRKYYVEEIYSDEKVAIIRDNETAEYYKVPYEVSNGKVTVKMDDKKIVHRTYEETEERTFSEFTSIVFAKEDYGTGETITVDKSKEAMSDSSWGSVNKTELRKKVLEAKNYKSLVKDVYADVQDGWEEAPSSKLKYPIMEIKDGKAVYNRYGLASALAYAEKNNETAVVNKVKSLYKKLDIDNEDEGGEKKMAKELEKDKEVVENKLDKDNKDIEKIRDDADAQEDDVKEEEKKEVKNSDKCDDIGFAKEVKKNEIEKDDEGEEDLEDDVDADKDYWKKKANALEIKNAEIEKELKKYKRADEEREMAAEVDKFAHCMSEEEAKELKNAIKECTMAEMKEKINAKVAEFALKVKNAEEAKKEIQYSINPVFELNTMKFSKSEVSSLDDIISNSHARIAGK
ncbi:MAG: hypothetical protein ACLTPN_02650 [Clostridia bacterium]|jgi:hypothetical protein